MSWNVCEKFIGRCSSSTCAEHERQHYSWRRRRRPVFLSWADVTYQQLPGDEDKDAAFNGGLGIKGRHLVLHLLEGQSRQLLNDRANAKNRCTLEREHRLVALLKQWWSAIVWRRKLKEARTRGPFRQQDIRRDWSGPCDRSRTGCSRTRRIALWSRSQDSPFSRTKVMGMDVLATSSKSKFRG